MQGGLLSPIGVEDLLNLPNRSIYLKFMIDGVPSQPFTASTFQVEANRAQVPPN